MTGLSDRLLEIVEPLPLAPGMRVAEIGCGPGAAARAVSERIGPAGHVLAIDRSSRAIGQLIRASTALIDAGRLTARISGADQLDLEPGEQPYDLAFAVRVGVFDGRHPEGYASALAGVSRLLVPSGRMFIDGGHPLREIPVDRWTGERA